jgi:plasmid stability protein
MATVTVRALNEETKTLLRLRAAQNGHSMEQEARDILQNALSTPAPAGNGPEGEHWLDRLLRQMKEIGDGGELPIPPREPMRAPFSFDDHPDE